MASRVGKYLLFETLGEGAFGKVKLGVHEETGEQVAVKIMDKSDIKAQEMTMNVRREIAIMKALKHRNIVNLRQVLTSQSKLYIVMDLVTGGELFTKILNEGKLEEAVARRYFQQLVDGIEYCHRRGVCHRDLKPENLLIDETTGELKITDFGLSAMKGASTTEELLHTQCGSPNYCAPEIIARHKQGYNGAKVDAWSCGIILFALLAGFLPFYDENTKVLYRMIQRDDVKFPRKFPPEAKDLVLKLLHKEPDKRYTLADVKKHPWFVVGYEGDDAPSKQGGSSPPVSRRRRRHARTRSIDTAPRSREGRDLTSKKQERGDLEVPGPKVDINPSGTAPTKAASAATDADTEPYRVPVSQTSAGTSRSIEEPRSSTPPQIANGDIESVSLGVGAKDVQNVPDKRPSTGNNAQQGHSQPSPGSTYGQSAVQSLLEVAAGSHFPPPPPFPAPEASSVNQQMSKYGVPGRDASQEQSAVPGGPGTTVRKNPGSSSPPPPPPSYSPPSRKREASLGEPEPGIRHPNPNEGTATTTESPENRIVGSTGLTSWPPRPSDDSLSHVNGKQIHVPIDSVDRAASPSRPQVSASAGRSDTSWQKGPLVDQKAQYSTATPNVLPTVVPPSLVEQRRLLYTKLEQEGEPTVQAPLPDLSKGPAASTVDDSDPRSPSPPPQFGLEPRLIPKQTHPTLERSFEELPIGPSPVNGTSDTKDGGKEPRASILNESNMKQERRDPAPPLIGDEFEDKTPMKQRLAAALARYRRIFRLGNNVGITASPSFSSNRGGAQSTSSNEGAMRGKNPANVEFFARAKAVTGAWGIILTQELEEDSDSDDETRQVTEEELEAFGRLLDFWDNRRASAKFSQKGEVILDDEKSIALSEKDILSIQSLLLKLEPKHEDDVEEVGAQAAEDSDQQKEIQQLLERDFSNPSLGSTGNLPTSPGPSSLPSGDLKFGKRLNKSRSVELISAFASGSQPPEPSPPVPSGSKQEAHFPQPPIVPVPPVPPKPSVTGPVDNRGNLVKQAASPPDYAPPNAINIPESVASPHRIPVTQSTLRDPFRPQLPPQYPAPNSLQANFPGMQAHALKEAAAVAPLGARIPQSISLDEKLSELVTKKPSQEMVQADGAIKKKSASDFDGLESSVSEGSGMSYKVGHVCSPPRDDFSTKGMFAFSMFSRKKSGTISSFDAKLPPERCLMEVGRILQSMGCSVMRKRGETKMKCEAPVKKEKLLVSITCTHEKGTTTVQFKKGRKDRSKIDAKEFLDFFKSVYKEFLDRVGPETKMVS